MSGRRAFGQRLEYSIQEPWAEAGLETMTDKERRTFEMMLRSMLIYRQNKRVMDQQVLESEWMQD